jgi:hypothetical protein
MRMPARYSAAMPRALRSNFDSRLTSQTWTL